jgi:hypothetical protein
MKADSYWSSITDKQSDDYVFMPCGLDAVGPVRVQAKSGVASQTIALEP